MGNLTNPTRVPIYRNWWDEDRRIRAEVIGYEIVYADGRRHAVYLGLRSGEPPPSKAGWMLRLRRLLRLVR